MYSTLQWPIYFNYLIVAHKLGKKQIIIWK